MDVRVFLEENNVRIDRLHKEVPSSPIWQASSDPLRIHIEEKGKFVFIL
jgi:hypothetical protein